MFNKLHSIMGLYDQDSGIEATTLEKAAIYGMYVAVSLVTILLVNIGVN